MDINIRYILSKSKAKEKNKSRINNFHDFRVIKIKIKTSTIISSMKVKMYPTTIRKKKNIKDVKWEWKISSMKVKMYPTTIRKKKKNQRR